MLRIWQFHVILTVFAFSVWLIFYPEENLNEAEQYLFGSFDEIGGAVAAVGTENHPNKEVPATTSSSSSVGVTSVHIYILSGQSNMLGYGSVEHLKKIKGEPRLAHLWNASTQTWTTVRNIRVVTRTYNVMTADQSLRPAPALTVGLGIDNATFGPELGFGWTLMTELYKNKRNNQKKKWTSEPTILLIKAAWNSKSLSVDFRPPSAGIRTDLLNYLQQPVPAKRYGNCYRLMIERIRSTINHLTKLLPDHIDPVSYDFKGMVWFQGWNDRVPKSVLDEYSSNLAHLIRDVRKELQTPNLPVIIGGLGQYQRKKKDQAIMREMLKQQESVTTLVNWTRFVPTARFFDGTPAAVERKGKYGVGFHYFGHADTIYDIGCAFGRAMVQLLKEHDENVKERISEAA